MESEKDGVANTYIVHLDVILYVKCVQGKNCLVGQAGYCETTVYKYGV